MSEKQYIAKVVTRTPRPRSKRLREAGIGSTASASVIIGSIGGVSGGSSNIGDGHTHTNLDTLEQISTDEEGYEYLTQYKSSTDEDGNEVLVKVTEKVKAGYADKAHTLDEDSPIIGMFLSKVHADTAAGKITFAAGLDAGEAAIDSGGNVTAKSVALANGSAAIDSDGNAEMASAVVRGTLKTKTASISDSMGSEGYVPGFTGRGWNMRMSGGLSYLDIDNLTLRGSMTVYELLIKQIRATNGGIVVSAANARVKRVDGSDSIAHLPGDTVKVWYEQGNPFKAGDFVRCMKWDTAHNRMHQYWAKVKAIGTDATYGDYTEFDYASFDTYKGGSGPAAIERLDIPRVGDEAVLFGSTVSGRQGVIYITAAEDEPPCIEVLEGVTTNSLEGVQRTRLGSLKQMSDTDFDGLLGGSGLYSDNAYLKGRFFLSSQGEEVDAFVSRVSNEITNGNLILHSDDMTGVNVQTGTRLNASYDSTIGAAVINVITLSSTPVLASRIRFWSLADTRTNIGQLNLTNESEMLTFSIWMKADATLTTLPQILLKNQRLTLTGGDVTTEWKQFSVTFAQGFTMDNNTMYLDMVGVPKGTMLYVSKVKLERGSEATDWCDVSSLESVIKQTADNITAKVGATGIDIDANTITLSASNTMIVDADGNALAAINDGKFKTAFLDLGNLQLTSDAVPTIDNFEWTAGYNTNGNVGAEQTTGREETTYSSYTFEVRHKATVVLPSTVATGDIVSVNAIVDVERVTKCNVHIDDVVVKVNDNVVQHDILLNKEIMFEADGSASYNIEIIMTATLSAILNSSGDFALPTVDYSIYLQGWNGTANSVKVYHNPSVAAYNNRTIIGSNGMVSYWGGKYLFHQSVPTGESDTSESGVTIIAGRNGWKITDNGIMISNNGGLDWHTA